MQRGGREDPTHSCGATLTKIPYVRDYCDVAGLTAPCLLCGMGGAFTMLRAHGYGEHTHRTHKKHATPTRRRQHSQRTRDENTSSVTRRALFTSRWAKLIMSVTMHCSVVALLLLASTFFTTSSAQDACASVDQPNPIAQQYPDVVTGNLNGTTMIVPISLALAQQLIPYPILEQAYRSLLPSFPADMYPMMVSTKHDHDLQVAAYNLTVADFTVSVTREAHPPPREHLAHNSTARRI